MDRDWQLETMGLAFEDPLILGVFVSALLLAGLLQLLLRRLRGPALGHASAGLLGGLPRSLRQRLAWLPRAVWILAFLALLLALARPQRWERQEVQDEGLDIFLCLDLSGSMHMRDMDREQTRTRIDVAKQVAEDFAKARTNDRIGLVGFARFPDLICPRTLDKQALARFLRPIEAKEPGSEEGATGIGLGLSLCVQHLEESEARSKLVILLTDGQETVGIVAPEKAGKLAADAGIRVYTIGIGTGNPTPIGLQPIDFSEIRGVAELTEGAFFEAADEEALQKVFAQIDELETSELGSELHVASELYPELLLLGSLLMILGSLLRLGLFPTLP